ncbi:MAG: HAD family hydrolase [Lentisphaerae bacterium]|nr:HAD family hydrolase [Lentisphaerota bacterium]
MNNLIIFDLDGTLINSVGGIAQSVNRTRQDFGFAPLPIGVITSFTGDGAKKLLERSCADVTLPVPLEEAVQVMIKNYAADPVYDTFLYDGVKEGLIRLKDSGWILAVVSNKPQLVAEKILAGLDVAQLFHENIGGGAGFPLKPAPDAIFHLMDKYHISPEKTFFAGDNHTDMNAAKNAGIKSIFCRYGFGEKLDTDSTVEVDNFTELTDYLIDYKG